MNSTKGLEIVEIPHRVHLIVVEVLQGQTRLARQIQDLQPIIGEAETIPRIGSQPGVGPTIQKVLETIGDFRRKIGAKGEGHFSLGTNHLVSGVLTETIGNRQETEIQDIQETNLEAEIQIKTTKEQMLQQFRVNKKMLFAFESTFASVKCARKLYTIKYFEI